MLSSLPCRRPCRIVVLAAGTGHKVRERDGGAGQSGRGARVGGAEANGAPGETPREVNGEEETRENGVWCAITPSRDVP